MPSVDERATQQRLIDAARALVEADGVEGLSMRKVAADVGVAPTAIYWHIGGREALMHAVLDAMIADLPSLAARGSTPRTRIASLAAAMRSQVLATGPAHQLAAELGRGAELSFPAQVALAREVAAAGLSGHAAADAVRSVLFVVGGFIMIEDNYRHRQPGSRTTQELWQAVGEPGIDDDLRTTMATPTDTNALFTFTVERLLDSLLD
jgi:TetR/AcrR family tetracycline transcriptional repressor